MHILVTGANGFIGRHLCGMLADVGCAVTAVSRRAWEPPAGSRVTEAALRRIQSVVLPDLAPETNFLPMMSGQDAIVHLAGRAHVLRGDAADPRQEFHRVNVELTESLAAAALEAGVQRFLYLSSIGVLGNRTTGLPFDANSPAAPLEAYAASKLEAERRLQTRFQGRGMLTIVRPPLVYGSGAKGNFERLMKLVDRVPVIPFGSIRARRSYVHVQNLCSFLYTCLRSRGGGVYAVCDGEDLPLNELLRIMAEGMNKKRWLLPMPTGVLRMLGSIVGRRAEVDRLMSDLVIDNREEKRLTGWEPHFTARDGIREMVQDFQRRAA